MNKLTAENRHSSHHDSDFEQFPIFGYYAVSESAQTLPFHFHHEHELIFVTEGEAVFSVGDPSTRYLLKPGSLIVLGSMEHHELTIVKYPYRRYVLTLSADFLLRTIQEPELISLFAYRPAGFCHQIIPGDQTSSSFSFLFQRLITESNERQVFWELRCTGLLTEMLITLYRQQPERFPASISPVHAQLIIAVQRYLQDHFKENITLTETASKHFVSKYHLSRIFREITGYHFKEYLTYLRLNEAKRLLLSTNLSVADIASECGYGDNSHFIRAFRECETISPGQYRKQFCNINATPSLKD